MSARVTANLQIVQGGLSYQSQPSAFQPSVSGTNGPTPGAVTITTSGTDISLAQLDAMGGLCVLCNIDSTNYVTVGIRDNVTNEFYPIVELLPTEFYVVRLSRKLPKAEAGTGTFSGTRSTLHAKADTANVILRIDAFDP